VEDGGGGGHHTHDGTDASRDSSNAGRI
jgi:hypothetical protein